MAHDKALATGREWRTTVMLQRIPPTLNSDSVRRVLDDLGFEGRYDAVHVDVPMNRRSTLNMRYAFVNFCTPEDAAICISTCMGRPFGSQESDGDSSFICNADYAHRQVTTYGAEHEYTGKEVRAEALQRHWSGRG